ncbi:MAG: MjaI family restriction endonuclease [Planctomycetes bacterium]|nr:MjaI family restriction endonuclease [Planctomycetota bacterium]
MKKGAELKAVEYRLSKPDEAVCGIDGYIGDMPVSIKPDTYKAKPSLPE